CDSCGGEFKADYPISWCKNCMNEFRKKLKG
ncbi:unnamed protein product, partial [marine sediment metagenome]